MREGPRIARRDRPWTDAHVAALCGPFDMPTADALANAVGALDARYPHCRVAWGFDERRTRWATSGESAHDVVVDAAGPIGDVDATLDAIAARGDLRSPLALIRYDDYLGLRMSHALGDGRTFNELFAAVLHTAFTGTPAPWELGPTQRLPLGTAVARTFGRQPGLLRAAVTDRPNRAPAPAGLLAPWSPARRTLTAAVPAQDRKAIIGSAPNSSWTSVLMSRLLRALHAQQVPVAPDVSVVVDLRRYLPTQSLDGNFVVGVPFSIDHRDSPETISATTRATLASGRPLATQVRATLHRGRTATGPVAAVDTSCPLRITFSAMGRPSRIDALPYRPGGPAIYVGGVEPDGPNGLTVLVSETSRTSMVSASFHQNVVPAAVVRAALAMATHPAERTFSPRAVTSWSA